MVRTGGPHARQGDRGAVPAGARGRDVRDRRLRVRGRVAGAPGGTGGAASCRTATRARRRPAGAVESRRGRPPRGRGPTWTSGASTTPPGRAENALLRAVLDDLKAGGSLPASTSTASLCALAGRLIAATGLSQTSISGFWGSVGAPTATTAGARASTSTRRCARGCGRPSRSSAARGATSPYGRGCARRARASPRRSCAGSCARRA